MNNHNDPEDPLIFGFQANLGDDEVMDENFFWAQRAKMTKANWEEKFELLL